MYMHRSRNNKGELWCCGCERWLHVDEYSSHQVKRSGRTYCYPTTQCKKCNYQRTRTWVENNRERVNQANTQRRRRIRQEFMTAYGGQCACCGETQEEFLTLEHIFGRDRKIQVHLELERLRNAGWPKENVQLLCFNCNSSKGVYGSCPHTWERGEHKPPLSVKQRRNIYQSKSLSGTKTS